MILDELSLQELFELLEDDDFDVPPGMIKAKNLVVALAAGGVAPENAAYVSKCGICTEFILSNAP